MSRELKNQQISGNPYASIPQTDDESADFAGTSPSVNSAQNTVDSKAMGLNMAASLERMPSGNPYANIPQTDEDEDGRSSRRIAASSESSAGSTLSKVDFEVECRRIFRQYMPALEKGPLRNHYRGFIARNQSSSPARRHRLVKHLQKYDLSQVQGLESRFNREKEPLTDEKLKQIERSADSAD